MNRMLAIVLGVLAAAVLSGCGGGNEGQPQPRVLAHTWGGQGEVQYELREVGGGVRLVITHQRLPSRDDVLSVSAGWHAHLDLLVARMRGREAPRYWRLHSRLEVDYADRFPV